MTENIYNRHQFFFSKSNQWRTVDEPIYGEKGVALITVPMKNNSNQVKSPVFCTLCLYRTGTPTQMELHIIKLMANTSCPGPISHNRCDGAEDISSRFVSLGTWGVTSYMGWQGWLCPHQTSCPELQRYTTTSVITFNTTMGQLSAVLIRYIRSHTPAAAAAPSGDAAHHTIPQAWRIIISTTHRILCKQKCAKYVYRNFLHFVLSYIFQTYLILINQCI